MEEYRFRLQQFEVRVAEHERFNSIPGQTSRQGINRFTDYTDDEIRNLGQAPSVDHKRHVAPEDEVYEEIASMVPIDWRSKGAVTPVAD